MILQERMSGWRKQLEWISVNSALWLLGPPDDTNIARALRQRRACVPGHSIFPWKAILDALRCTASSAGALRLGHVSAMVAPQRWRSMAWSSSCFVQGTTWAMAGLDWEWLLWPPAGNPDAGLNWTPLDGFIASKV